MLVTPFLIRLGPRLAAGAGRIPSLTRLLEVRSADEQPPRRALDDHVIIAGYGLAGRELARSLAACGIDYVVLDLNVENVRLAASDGVRAFFGDVTSPEVLDHLAVHRARELVLTVNDPDAARRAVSLTRSVAPGLRIIARAAYLEDRQALIEAGAAEVVVAEVEAAVEISYLVLKGHGADARTLEHRLREIRSEEVPVGPAQQPTT
jgi:CPA2 family monovalent cation:H+ antiporter-2